MKRFLSLIITIFILIITLSSCDLRSDSDICIDYVKDAIFYLDNDNKSAFKELFSSYTLSLDSEIDNQIDLLFDYYEGVSTSLEKQARKQNKEINEGKYLVSYECSYKVFTSDNSYQLAILLYVKNDFENDKIGIESFYLLKDSENPSPSFAYWGDGNWLLGCHIQKV